MVGFISRFLFFTFLVSSVLEAKLPDLSPEIVVKKSKEIMRLHASQKELSNDLTKRIVVNYLEEIDPTKTYFIESDIVEWTEPTDETIRAIRKGFLKGDFSVFYGMHDRLVDSIERRKVVEAGLSDKALLKQVSPQDFKEASWPKDEAALAQRILEYRSLQHDAMANMNDDLKERALGRILKRQAKYEEDMQNQDAAFRQSTILTNVLKATAAALDTHTAYLTPEEAKQFMINVQQRLFGIGVQLRDDINGFTIIKVLEGGPAAKDKRLKAKDRIIAVDGEPVVGMDISDAVELIRGEEGTSVILTVLRQTLVEGELKEEKLDIPIERGEVVLTETRYKSGYEPFGQGVIAYLRLYSFYQDADSSSAQDLKNALDNLRKEHKVEGVVLDLRQNSGGLLSQAVAVTSLFITKGIVVSIKDENGKVQHLRDVEGKMAWGGPLIVLVDRTSASASEIVAQTLQDYGRALIVGDDHTFGKGSFQTFTLDTLSKGGVNPEGEYKVTRGRYYTVSGKTPQLVGVVSDIVVPSIFSESPIGEKFAKFPLESDTIEPNYDDDLQDIPFIHRLKYESFYKFNLQPKSVLYQPILPKLRRNSSQRLVKNQNYQNFLEEVKKKHRKSEEKIAPFGQNDLQLDEAFNIMKDIIILLRSENIS